MTGKYQVDKFRKDSSVFVRIDLMRKLIKAIAFYRVGFQV